MFRTKLILALTCLLRSYVCEETDVMSMLPNLLQEYCPGANACREHQLSLEENGLIDSQLQSCCTECSCGLNCSENGNCCFHSKVSEHFGYKTYNEVRECLYPTTKPPQAGNERIYFQSYYMVSSFNNTNLHSGEPITHASCGDEKVAPWGTLYPVYSGKKNKIYKNIKCAKFDGVDDEQQWDALMFCKTEFGKDASQFVQGLDEMSLNEKCSIDFLVPNILNERYFHCFENLIRSCPRPDRFEIPDARNLSKEVIISLCESGLISPFLFRNMYANVFCHICNGEFFEESRLCSSTSGAISLNNFGDVIAAKYGRVSFVGLIDQNFIENVKKSTNMETGIRMKQACDTTNTCRPLFCSSGKLRDQAGNCVYPNKNWFVDSYFISIKLTSNESVNVSDVFKVPFMTDTHTLPKLKSPWPENWKIYNIVYEKGNENNEFTSVFIVAIYTSLNWVQPKRFIRKIEKTVTLDWVLQHDGDVFILKASLSPISFPNNMLIKQKLGSLFEDESKNAPDKEHIRVYKPYARTRISEQITKLYLCEQVELRPSEFILSQDRMVVFIFRTQRYLYRCQFSVISSNSEGETRVRICTEDSGMEISVSRTSSFFDMYDICSVIVALIVLRYCFV